MVKPGGVVIISTPLRTAQDPVDRNDLQEWFPSRFKDLVGDFFEVAALQLSYLFFWCESYSASRTWRKAIYLVSLVWNPFYAWVGGGHINVSNVRLAGSQKKQGDLLDRCSLSNRRFSV